MAHKLIEAVCWLIMGWCVGYLYCFIGSPHSLGELKPGQTMSFDKAPKALMIPPLKSGQRLTIEITGDDAIND